MRTRLFHVIYEVLLPFRNLFATPKNNNLPPSGFGDDSRLRLALAAQKKHTIRKYNISARVPGGNGGIWAHFSFFHPYKKCAKITSVPPGSLADMLYLHVVCLFCAASARRRRESSPSRWWQVVVFGLWQTNSETAIAPRCPRLDHNHVYIADRMPLLSTNRGHFGRSNATFTSCLLIPCCQDEEQVRTIVTRLLRELLYEME